MAWFKLIASVIVIAMNGMHDVCMYVVEHFVLPPNDGHLVENKFFFFFFCPSILSGCSRREYYTYRYYSVGVLETR